MNGSSYIKKRQQLWALRKTILQRGGPKNLDPNALGYSQNLQDNLYVQLSNQTEKDFRDADGGELRGTTCNMQALHSSSALGVNIFEYWRSQDALVLKSLAKSLKIPESAIQSLAFEQKIEHAGSANRADFPKDPNLDVLISYANSVIGVECKYSEPYGGNHSGIKEVYLKHSYLWEDIPNLKELAHKISPKDNEYDFLHPAQLIKHILALKHKCAQYKKPKSKFWLVYLWYDVPTADGAKHRQEIKSFEEIVEKDGIRFHPISYQELIHNMYHYGLRDEHESYLDYVAERYL